MLNQRAGLIVERGHVHHPVRLGRGMERGQLHRLDRQAVVGLEYVSKSVYIEVCIYMIYEQMCSNIYVCIHISLAQAIYVYDT